MDKNRCFHVQGHFVLTVAMRGRTVVHVHSMLSLTTGFTNKKKTKNFRMILD